NSSYTFKYQNFKFKNLSSIKVFFEKFLGLKIEENVLEIHPKFEFSINLNGLKIETKSGEENSVGINGVKFVNLNKIDLSLLTEKNLTFVYKKVL
ncbi:MAG: hypothetical protein J5779_03150, partial [Clostridia bacterium]|nr:hypothetical protein [Clostridia bacterium]